MAYMTDEEMNALYKLEGVMDKLKDKMTVLHTRNEMLEGQVKEKDKIIANLLDANTKLSDLNLKILDKQGGE